MPQGDSAEIKTDQGTFLARRVIVTAWCLVTVAIDVPDYRITSHCHLGASDLLCYTSYCLIASS